MSYSQYLQEEFEMENENDLLNDKIDNLQQNLDELVKFNQQVKEDNSNITKTELYGDFGHITVSDMEKIFKEDILNQNGNLKVKRQIVFHDGPQVRETIKWDNQKISESTQNCSDDPN